MNEPQAIAEAFRKLQAGDAAGALAAAKAIMESAPFAARGYLVAGLALRMLERYDESRGMLERASTLDPRDYAAGFELGMALEFLGDPAAALPHFERAAKLRPAFLPARHALGLSLHRAGRVAEAIEHLRVTASSSPHNADWQVDLAQALLDLGQVDDAQPLLDRALATQPDHARALRHAGRARVAKGDFARAAELFADAAAHDPGDESLQTFIFQSELLLGHWDRGWAAYRHARGRPEHLASLAEIRGKEVTIVAEQGLGDILFFLRFASALRGHAQALHLAGGERLHSLLERTGLFETLRVSFDAADDANAVLLTGDLPEITHEAIASCPPSLRIAPDPARLDAWRAKLEAAGPRPWTGVTWRAGTPNEELAFGLHKQAPIAQLLAALKPAGGTVVALQRHPAEGELDTASHAFGDKVHDFSRINDDLEDALAILSLLDRHVGVSNTNTHLAAAAGKTADVLVPFPPEWRWGLGDESPWFPGFRIHRQSIGGDWSKALATLAASASAGSTSRA